MRPLWRGFVIRNYSSRWGIRSQMIRWAFFFLMVFIFCGAFAGHLSENTVKGGFGIEPGVKCDAYQGDPVISRVLYFPGHLTDAVFINKIIKVFPECRINDPRQLVRMYI